MNIARRTHGALVLGAVEMAGEKAGEVVEKLKAVDGCGVDGIGLVVIDSPSSW